MDLPFFENPELARGVLESEKKKQSNLITSCGGRSSLPSSAAPAIPTNDFNQIEIYFPGCQRIQSIVEGKMGNFCFHRISNFLSQLRRLMVSAVFRRPRAERWRFPVCLSYPGHFLPVQRANFWVATNEREIRFIDEA